MQLRSPDWTDPPLQAGASGSPVQIWRLHLSDLDGDPWEALRPLTVPSEHDRARRFEFDADRHRHLAGRALARLVLSRRYGCDPRILSIAEGPHGKPYLKAPPDDEPPLHFNIAHTADLVVVACSQTHPVGIDVESQRRDANVQALAQRVFTEKERRHWRTHSKADRHDLFIHLWTCKEAFLKATGRGLQRAPRTIECLFKRDAVTKLTDADGHSPSSPDASAGQWAVHPFLATEGIAGAIVRKHALPSPVDWIDAAGLLNRPSQA